MCHPVGLLFFYSTVSIAHTMSLFAGGLSGELERVWKEAVMARFKADLVSRNVPDDSENNENLRFSRVVPVEIRIQHLQTVIYRPYCSK